MNLRHVPLLLLAYTLVLSGCLESHGTGNTRAEVAAADVVITSLASYFKTNPGVGVVEFEMHDLDGGCAVLLHKSGESILDAAFWVRDGKVYTVNDAARALLPGHPAAPDTVTFDRVRAVVH